MMELVNPAFAAIIISCMLMSVVNRLKNCLYIAAFQGILVALIPLAVSDLKTGALILALAVLLIKAVALPRLILYTIREIRSRREIEPKISYPLSIVFSLGGLLLALWLMSRMPLPGGAGAACLMAATPLFMLYTGLFVMISRLKAITLVIGFLIFENGIYLFGALPGLRNGMIPALGLGLDLLVGLFAYGVARFSINRSFDNLDRNRLSGLAAEIEGEEN